MPTSDWESVRQLRGDALWKDADQVLLTRAMLRCGLAAGWVTLVALAISGGAWIGGLPMLLASGLSLLHASHTVVLRLEGRLPRPLRRLFERLFVYPDQPHVNWVGIAELLGLVSLGMATGWPLRLLAGDPAAAAVGSVITVGILGSVVANTAGHLVWEVDQESTAPKWMRSVRIFIGPFGAAVGLALLWWASPATPARFVAVAGPLVVMVGSWRLIAQVKAQVKDMDDIREQTIDLTRRQDSDLVHSALKNQARAIMDDLVLIPDASLRDGDPLLAVAVGFAANLSRPAGPHGFPASWTGGCAWIAGGWAFGLWQSRHELSTGRYSRAQTLSPTKLWHQYIVYPVLGYWVTATEWSAYGATGAAPTTSRIVQVALVIATTGAWAILTADAVRRPKLGHGTLDRARLRTIARRLIHRRCGALEVRGPDGVALAVDSGAEPVMGFEAAGQVGHGRRFWATAWPNRSDRRPTISGR